MKKIAFCLLFLTLLLLAAVDFAVAAPLDEIARPFVQRYCGKCHGDAKAEADLHLGKLLRAERLDETHEKWFKVARALERQEMPPPEQPQPTEQERTAVAAAIREALKAFYARTAAGDPGELVLRRLTNAEYDYVVQDLTGVPLAPAWRFPRNETAGEGFDNVAAALGVRSSALMEKYLEAAEEVAAHAFMQPSRGLVFSRLTSEQSSRPQRAHESCAELKSFYDAIAVEIPKRASLGRALVATWRFRHRERFGNADLAEFARQQQVDPRYAEWLWRELHDKRAGEFQKQLLQEPFAALPDPPELVESRCQQIADHVTLALHATIGQSLKELPTPTPFYMPGRRELAVTRKVERTFNTDDVGGLTLYLVASDAGVPTDESTKAYAVWEQLEFGGQKTAVLVGEMLRQHALVLHDRLPDGRQLGKGEFAVPVPSLIEIRLPVESAPAKSGVACRAKFRLAGPPSSVAMIGLVTNRELGLLSPNQNGTLVPGRIIPGAELRAAGDSDSFRKAWTAYDEFFQRFGLPHFPTEIDLDTAPRNGFNDASGIYAVYGIAPERHLHRFTARDEWLKQCVLSPQESARLEGLWADAFYLTDEHTQRIARLTKLHGLHELPPAEQEAGLLAKTESEIRPRETPTWGGRPYYYRLPDSPAQRLQSLRGVPAEFEQANRTRSQAELLKFADRAWRRPLEQDERQTLAAYYLRLRGEGLDDEAALRRSLVRILVSPNFLLKVERGTGFQPVSTPQNKERTKPHGLEAHATSANELASRLSFFLWSSLPDAELRRVAADDSLLRDDVLREQTVRMLRDERARRLAVEFFGQWLAFKGFDKHDRTDRERFPEFTDELRQDLYDETVLFFDDLIRNDGSVRDVFFGKHTFLNVALALHYGLNPQKLAWPKEAPPGYRNDWTNRERIARERAKGTPLPLVRVEVDSRQRGGVLGMGSVLTMQSLSLRTSPVNRGKWLYEAVLGREIPEPPANAGTLPDDDQEQKTLTLREQLERHRRDASCAACHARFDPLGFALERFDAIGRWREKDSVGRPIDDAGELAGQPIVGLMGVREYLAAHEDELFRNFSRKLLGFALGRAWQPSDELLLDQMRDNGRAAEERFANYVTTIVLSPQFRHRRGAASQP